MEFGLNYSRLTIQLTATDCCYYTITTTTTTTNATVYAAAAALPHRMTLTSP